MEVIVACASGERTTTSVQHAGEVDVLGVVAPAGDHPGVLLALHRRADGGGHADTSVPAAALTASTMLW